MSGINNIQAEGQIYDILAPEIVNDYVEKLGKTCINPNGYTKGSLILATDGSNVQRLYKTTSNISSNQVISEGGNVELKKLEDLFDDLEDALNDEIDDIDTELGNVKQALSDLEDNLSGTVSDSESYVLRQGKGSLVDMDLVGGTIAWNQLVSSVNKSYSQTVTGSTSTSINKNIVSQVIQNHIYYVRADISVISDNSRLKPFVQVGFATSLYKSYGILKLTSGTNIGILAGASTYDGSSTVEIGDATVSFDNANVFDLTQMFGTTIADYIYSLEQATAGAGVAFFRKLFPKSYYAYNAGNLLSVKPSGRIARGFNQWDEEWVLGSINSDSGLIVTGNYVSTKNLISVIEGETYYVTPPNTSGNYRWIYAYDKNGNFINTCWGGTKYLTLSTGNTFVVPQGVAYIRFILDASYGLVYNNDICINISKTTGTPKNGDYVPYDSSEYLFPSLDLRGIPKLVNNKLSYDGDIYKADGNVTRKYGIVDFGSLTWQKSDNYPTVFYATQSDVKGGLCGLVCSKYLFNPVDFQFVNIDLYPDKSIAKNANSDSKTFYVKDTSNSSMDAAAFKTAMSGVYLVYELATPTSEDAPVYANPQRSFADGTEEWLDTRDVTIPVGNNSIYYQNDTYPAVTAYADGLYDVLNEAKAAIAALGDDESGRTTASRPYTQGEFFYMDGKMYKVLTSIAKDAAFTVGTNCSQTTIFAELKALAQ